MKIHNTQYSVIENQEVTYKNHRVLFFNFRTKIDTKTLDREIYIHTNDPYIKKLYIVTPNNSQTLTL